MFDYKLAIETLRGAYQALSKVQEIKQSLKLQEEMQKILDLQGMLLDARSENMELRDRVFALEQQLKINNDLEFDEVRGFYWLENNGRRLAYCHKCWVEHNRKSPMADEGAGHRCHACGHWYDNPSHKTPSRAETDYDLLGYES